MNWFFATVLIVSGLATLGAAMNSLRLYLRVENLCPGFNHKMRELGKKKGKNDGV